MLENEYTHVLTHTRAHTHTHTNRHTHKHAHTHAVLFYNYLSFTSYSLVNHIVCFMLRRQINIPKDQ